LVEGETEVAEVFLRPSLTDGVGDDDDGTGTRSVVRRETTPSVERNHDGRFIVRHGMRCRFEVRVLKKEMISGFLKESALSVKEGEGGRFEETNLKESANVLRRKTTTTALKDSSGEGRWMRKRSARITEEEGTKEDAQRVNSARYDDSLKLNDVLLRLLEIWMEEEVSDGVAVL
jgi:hypothetical protein